jgi:hypothetical protein
MTRLNQSAATNHHPAGQSDGSGKVGRDRCSRRAFPVAVVELGRSAEVLV